MGVCGMSGVVGFLSATIQTLTILCSQRDLPVFFIVIMVQDFPIAVSNMSVAYQEPACLEATGFRCTRRLPKRQNTHARNKTKNKGHNHRTCHAASVYPPWTSGISIVTIKRFKD